MNTAKISLRFFNFPRHRSARRALSSIFILAASFAFLPAQAQEVSQHYDNVLGTSFDVTVYAPDQSGTDAAITATLAEIARMEQELSTYRDDSELMQLNASRSTTSASEDLLAVVSACEDWIARSEGEFSCRLGAVNDFWDAAEEAQELPTRSASMQIARTAAQAELIIDPAQSSIQLGEGIKLDPSGLAKGYIIDQAMAMLREEIPGATAIKVDIGGDAMYWGAPPTTEGWEVMVADPESGSDNADFVSSLVLDSKAIATSGHNARTRQILMREFSHIFTPNNGWPVFNGIYAVVIADDAMTADAVATALSVQTSANALSMVDNMPGIEALIIDQGAQLTSSGWNEYLSEELQLLSNADFSLSMEYEIPSPGDGSYARPYVAIWVSDKNQQAIKNLVLLGGEQRWAGTNSRWWRRAGRLASLDKINVTRPTRAPGHYTLTWDGRDDSGNLLQPGTYLLNVEASREHGGHNYRSVEFEFREGVQMLESERYGEVGAFSVTIEMSLPE